MEDRKERRGAKKGRPKPIGSGRKATGRERDKNISFRVTEEEKKLIYEALDEIGGTRIDAILKVLKIKK